MSHDHHGQESGGAGAASGLDAGSAAREIRRSVTDRAACEFYHTVQLPDGSVTRGQWDLRAGVGQYLGGVDFAGRSVLEVGPASGFLSFHMEGQGAAVTCIEPPLDTFWDLVPRAGAGMDARKARFKARVEMVRNSFWYLHALRQSRVRLFEANAYAIPESLGTFDYGLLAAVLLHCSCPVRMIESLSRRVSRTMIICDLYAEALGTEPVCSLVPTDRNDTIDTWWMFTPAFFVNYLGVLGFGDWRVVRHRQPAAVGWVELFTVVANRWPVGPDEQGPLTISEDAQTDSN